MMMRKGEQVLVKAEARRFGVKNDVPATIVTPFRWWWPFGRTVQVRYHAVKYGEAVPNTKWVEPWGAKTCPTPATRGRTPAW